MTHICVSKLSIIGSDNGLSPDRRQAIIWANAGLLSIGPLRIYFSENLIKIQQFSLKKMHVKMSSLKWRPSCLGLNVLKQTGYKLVSVKYIFWLPNNKTRLAVFGPSQICKPDILEYDFIEHYYQSNIHEIYSLNCCFLCLCHIV